MIPIKEKCALCPLFSGIFRNLTRRRTFHFMGTIGKHEPIVRLVLHLVDILGCRVYGDGPFWIEIENVDQAKNKTRQECRPVNDGQYVFHVDDSNRMNRMNRRATMREYEIV